MAQSPAATVAQALLALAAFTLTSTAWASPELAKQRNCMNCHALDRKIVGPSFRDVALRYGGKPGAANTLAAKIRAGGAGAWGPVPMAANPQVSAEEAQKLANWVLGLK